MKNKQQTHITNLKKSIFMKKLFTFFAAALVALAVNADPVPAGAGKLSEAISGAAADAVIELAEGDFTESSNIAITQNITIKAADAKKKPVIKLNQVYFEISAGATLTFENVKFDCSSLKDNAIKPTDATDGNGLALEGCEFYNDTANKAIIHCVKNCKLDVVTINDCSVNNITKSFFFNENTSTLNLTVTNSTFANVTTVTSSYYAGLIDTRATSGSVQVNHCTFYNVQIMNTDYAAVGKVALTSGAAVSNCIFVMPTSTSGVRTIRDKVTASNCLVFNYASDSGYGMQSNVSKVNCSKDKDPQFTDAANGDFTLSAESPAIDAGTDGKTLGDKRWWPVISYPKTDFAKEYAFTGTAASLESGLIKEDHWGAGREYIRYDGGMHSFATASWTIEATRACFVKVKVYTATNEWEGHTSSPYGNSGHNFSVELWNEDSQRLDTIAEDVYQPSPWDGKRNYPAEGIELGNILVPEAGIYTIRLKNMRDFSRCGVDSVTFTYASDLPSAAAKGGWDSWANVLEFTLAKDAKTASVKKTFNKGDEFEFKMLINGTEDENFRANGWWFKRDATTATGITGNGNNMKIIADYTGEYTFTWTFATNTLAVTFPEPTLENGWYLVGTFNEVDEWTVNELTADKQFAVNPGNNDEFVITADLKEGDRFKAAYVYLDEIQNDSYKPADGDGYVVNASVDGNDKKIYFRVESYQDWGGHFYIAPREPKNYYGVTTFTTEGTVIDPAVWRVIEWGITRNANKTLTFDIYWNEAITGIVPQVNLGGFTNMQVTGNKATLTTTATYEDGTELHPEFYLAYAGAAKSIPVTYTVGEENEKPAAPVGKLEIDFRTNPRTILSGGGFLPTGVEVAGTWHDNQHGYNGAIVSMYVLAGNYKITVGNCEYNNSNGAVKNADGTETLDLIDKNGQTITAIETPKNCYHQNTTENITSVWFVAEAAQTIQIVCPQYAPYLNVEKVESVPEPVVVYNVTFANAEGATGVLPANLVDLAPTTAITLPKNFSMYKEGYTFDGWTDGEDLYDPGFEYEVTDDVTFTAVYAENTVSLAGRTEAVTIKWEFSQSKGVAPINVSGTTTFVVAQATIGEKKIDVKLPIDATEGKFVNSANSWTQINPGVIFSIPSAKDAVITYKQYDAGAVTTPEINVSATDATYQLVAAGTSGQLYYEYVQVVLPKPTATSISNTEVSSKAQKLIENGQIVIIKNGVKYNVLGACLK